MDQNRENAQRDVKNEDGKHKLLEELEGLKTAFGDFVNIVSSTIDKDCLILRSSKDYESIFERMKKRYIKLAVEVSSIVTHFVFPVDQSKESQDILLKIDSSKKSFKRIELYSSDTSSNAKCCSRKEPHLHEFLDGAPIVIQLKKGSPSEVQLVKNMVNEMDESTLDKVKSFCAKHKFRQKAEKCCKKYKDCCKCFEKQLEKQKGNDIKLNCSNKAMYRPSGLSLPSTSTQDSVQFTTEAEELEKEKGDVLCQTVLNKVNATDESLLIFDASGNPLTDSNGKPLVNVKGHIVIKYEDDKPISHINGDPIFDKSGLPFVSSFEEPLRDPQGNPLRLFNEDRIPLTDEFGYILQLNNGCYSIVLDQYNRIFSDAHGTAVFDCQGNKLNTELLPVSKQSHNVSEHHDLHPLLYNQKGFLLTDTSGKPLSNSQGQLLIKKDSETGTITDIFGNPVFDAEGNIYGAKLNKPKLTVFNHEYYPLTNTKGEILKTVGRKPLVRFDQNGKPYLDHEKQLIFDEKGVASNQPEYKPYSDKPAKHKRILFKGGIQLYNHKGFPLMDFDGSPLINSNGEYLVKTKNGVIAHDLNGNPVFDEMGVPIARIEGCWLCPNGNPYRVFDSEGRPLTNKIGKDLLTLSSKILIQLDVIGRPLLTPVGSSVCDCNGNPATDSKFDPSQIPLNNELKMQVFFDNAPLKVFDKLGRPLSDGNGMALFNNQGRCLLQFNEEGIPTFDFNGQTIYDKHSIPLNCSPATPLITTSGEPFRLFNKDMQPLTNRNGFPLVNAEQNCLVKFDAVGRPISDINGESLLDMAGRNILTDIFAKPNESPTDVENFVRSPLGLPLVLFDKFGFPLTDINGAIQVNADGSHMIVDHSGLPTMDSKGGPVYNINKTPVKDIFTRDEDLIEKEDFTTFIYTGLYKDSDAFGRPMKDHLGNAQFDSFGRPIFDLYRRTNYNSKGQPISNAFGRSLLDGKAEKTFRLNFDPKILSMPLKSWKKSELPDMTKDLIGGPLFDNNGLPLYNQYGKPLIDIYGKDLYDKHGYPLSNNNGRPVSEQIRRFPGVIIKVKDISCTIQVPDAVKSSIDEMMVGGKRIEQSPQLSASWIFSRDHLLNALEDKSNMYTAIVRVTTFDDRIKVYELLHASQVVRDISRGSSSSWTVDEDIRLEKAVVSNSLSYNRKSHGKLKTRWLSSLSQSDRQPLVEMHLVGHSGTLPLNESKVSPWSSHSSDDPPEPANKQIETVQTKPLWAKKSGSKTCVNRYTKDVAKNLIMDTSNSVLHQQYGKHTIDFYSKVLYEKNRYSLTGNAICSVFEHIQRYTGSIAKVNILKCTIQLPDFIKSSIRQSLIDGKRIERSPQLAASWIISRDHLLNALENQSSKYDVIVLETMFDDGVKVYELLYASQVNKKLSHDNKYGQKNDVKIKLAKTLVSSHNFDKKGHRKLKTRWLSNLSLTDVPTLGRSTEFLPNET